MSRIGPAFAAARGRTGLVPYLTAGYPSLEVTLAMMRALADAGALALEVGVPFSDPIADGPDIQRASEWALRQGVGVTQVLEVVARFRTAAAVPVVVMTYLNPILRGGIERFARAAAEAGVDGVLISDLPPDESPEVWACCDRAGLDTVTLVAPTTETGRLPRLLARCRGFAYCLARTGVTGAGSGFAGSLPDRIAELRRHTPLPIAVGFGISSPGEARALRGLADAVVVGAAFMREVAREPSSGVEARVRGLASDLIAALDEVAPHP
ncbi:MAG TPA: tryptophan synthase subunit alpha [Candidatus Eisenbacteria bacterium]